MLASRLLLYRAVRHRFTARACIVGHIGTTRTNVGSSSTSAAVNRKSLESLNEDQVSDLFTQFNFEPSVVKEQGLNGTVLAMAIDGEKDLEQLGMKPLQARAMFRLIEKWKTSGIVRIVPVFDGIERIVPVTPEDNTEATSAAILDKIEYSRRESMNRDYYAGRGSDTAAAQRLQVAVQADDHLAQAYIGMLHNLGTAHTPRDEEKAAHYARCAWPWLEQNAAMGCPFSQFAMGYFIVNDIHRKKSKIEGIIFLGMAVKQGHAGAQSMLGYCCTMGIAKDDVAAAKYYKLAADQGYATGQNNYAWNLAHGEGVPKDEVKALVYYKLAAEQGEVYACNNLAACYANGTGVTKDLQVAVEYYKLAADQGDASALCSLGYCYANGNGVTKNGEEAVRYYKLAALQGNHCAECNLGVCYDKGIGVAANPAEAVRYYNLAVEHGSVDALHNLAFSYYYGTGVAKSLERATELFERAAALGHANSGEILKELAAKK